MESRSLDMLCKLSTTFINPQSLSASEIQNLDDFRCHYLEMKRGMFQRHIIYSGLNNKMSARNLTNQTTTTDSNCWGEDGRKSRVGTVNLEENWIIFYKPLIIYMKWSISSSYQQFDCVFWQFLIYVYLKLIEKCFCFQDILFI